MRTEQLVSQLVLAASWDMAADRPDPVDSAAHLMGLHVADPRLALVRCDVAAATGLTWEEQVGLAAHLLLTPAVDQALAA